MKEALVVKRDVLFSKKDFQGFLPAGEFSFLEIISSQHFYHLRGDELEQDFDLQQIIPYVWIINPLKKEVFAYKRAVSDTYRESRLKNKWSCGLGGHIEKEDSTDPIQSAMMRELIEEVKIEEYPQPRIVGYLNDDSNDVGKVHFGIVALAETTHDVEKGDDEMAHGQFYSIDELEKVFADPENEVETWTQLSWPFVKEYLSGL